MLELRGQIELNSVYEYMNENLENKYDVRELMGLNGSSLKFKVHQSIIFDL